MVSRRSCHKTDLPTFAADEHDGSKHKLHRIARHGGATVSLSQAVLLAAISASLAAVLTAFGASHYLVEQHRFDVSSDSVVTLAHRTQSTFSRTMTAVENDASPSTAEKLKLFSSFGIMSSADSKEQDDIFAGRIQEPEFLAPNDNLDTVNDDGKLKVVWLMSFPNSGTSFTLHLTREASNTTTATNYGLEGDIKDEPSVPVYNNSIEGPYFELIPNRVTNLPPKYILTKTHCGGFCSDCKPEGYVETSRSFQIMCQTGKRGFEGENGEMTTEFVTYDTSNLGKAIHILRHPLDNVVARFHLYYKREESLGHTDFVTRYPYNSTGFNAWCADQDETYDLSKLRWIDDALMEKLNAVPCKQEFFRYLQWHNLAFETSRSLALPTLIMYYDDYSNDFELATKRLLTFLELPSVGGVEPFSHGKEYRDYYSVDQRAAVLDLVKEQASAETWHWVKDYDFS